jgi:molybdate transport system substrate-binding protein
MPAARALLAIAAVTGLLAGCSPGPAESPQQITVFAAASLRDVLQDIGGRFKAATGTQPVFNFSASNLLAQQIEAAPGADVFLSADEKWMDELEAKGRLQPGSRRRFLSNRLVVVAKRDSPFVLSEPGGLADLPFEHLSLADPAAVPAGRYAKGFLEKVRSGDSTLWERVADRVLPALDVRAALAVVEADPRMVGIVYRTDAAASRRVKVLLEIPPDLTPPIHYAAAAVAGSRHRSAAQSFLDFLAGPEAVATFEKAGFLVER